MSVNPYRRKINYYETDKMGFVHHSNYIRYLEEARLDFMHQIGMDYKSLEDEGVIVPVTGVSCQYKQSLYYGDEVEIFVRLTAFNGVRMAFRYEIRSKGVLSAMGESGHCFLGESGAPINLKKRFPALCETAMKAIEE